MLTIRRAQMEIFERHALEDFSRRLRKRLIADSRPGDSAGDEDFSRSVHEGIRLAEQFYLTRERDVVRLLCFWHLHFGTAAPKLPKAALCILRTWGVPPDTKLARFEAWVLAQRG